MPLGAPIHIRALRTEALEFREVPLAVIKGGSPCTVRLRCLAGASGLHLVLSAGGNVRLRVEVPADGGETVAVQVELDEGEGLQVWSPGRDVLFLPVEDRYDPPAPIRPAAPDASLDLVLVVDGTARWASQEEREDHFEKLLGFVGQISDGHLGCRAVVVAFGDQPPPNTTAMDLIPFYHFFPREEEARSLQPLDIERLRRELFAIPATTGGDFVDALADALDACARLRWREGTRKLLVLSGDSPGHSVLYPLRKGADACVRKLEVDTQALRLHRLGVEMVTIYRDPPAPSESGLYDLAFKRDLLLGARLQYARLASLPELAFQVSTFNPELAAAAVRGRKEAIGRGTSLGELVEEVPSGPGRVTAPGAEAHNEPVNQGLPKSAG